jgi:hypothetical protein
MFGSLILSYFVVLELRVKTKHIHAKNFLGRIRSRRGIAKMRNEQEKKNVLVKKSVSLEMMLIRV